jgi:hypothetical protein
MFANITEGRYRRAELNARWAWRVHTENPGGIKDLKWLRQNWHSISGDAPNWSDFEHKDVKNKYLCLDNIFAAARSSNINMIEIGRNLRRATSAATSLPTTGNKQQENFKSWAVRQLQVAAPDKIDQIKLLARFDSLSPEEQHRITSAKPSGYFKSRNGWYLTMDLLYSLAEEGRPSGAGRGIAGGGAHPAGQIDEDWYAGPDQTGEDCVDRRGFTRRGADGHGDI